MNRQICNEGKAMARIARLGRLALVCSTFALGACAGESAQSLMDSAKKKLEAKESKAAVIQLKNALQKDPKLAEARYLLGKLLLEGGDMVGAEIELQKAQELGYADDELVPQLAKAKLGRGQADKVIAEFGAHRLQKLTAQADLQAVLARAYGAVGKMAEARTAIDAALGANPAHVGAQLLQVRMLVADKDIKGAEDALDKVISTSPDNSEARQTRGEILLFKGERDAALAAFNEAIQRDKHNISAYVSALWILAGKKDLAGIEAQLKALAAAEPQHPQTKFFTAMLALEKGDIKTANEQAQQLLKQAPDNVTVLQLASSVELRKGAVARAEANLAKAMQIAPSNTKIRLLLAQTHLRAGDSAKTIRLLQPMVEGATPQWEPVALMAQAYLLSGDVGKAETFFAQAAKLNPNDSRSRTALALAQVSKGQMEQGLDELKAISLVDPGSTADLAMINALLSKRDSERALAAIARLETKQPQLPMSAYLRGQAELQRGGQQAASAAFEAALKIDPAFFPATSSLASLDIAHGRPELARQRYEKLVAQDPHHLNASMALIRVSAQTGSSKDELAASLDKIIKANPTEVAPRMVLVALRLEQKQFKLALALAQEGLAVLPDNLELLDLLGQAQFMAGDINLAISSYNKIASLQPNSPQALMRLAEIHTAQMNPSDAAQDLKRALVVKPGYLPALQGLMAIEVAAGRRQGALSVARSVQNLRGSEAIGFALEGDLAISHKDFLAAAKAYKTSLEKQPSTETAIKLHQLLLVTGPPDEALKMEQQWLKKNPKDANFIFHLGDVALAKSNFEGSRRYYEEVLRILPDNPSALNNMAWLLNRENKPEALQYALRATALAPKEPAFLDTLAQVYASSSQWSKAIETQKAALSAGPGLHVHRLRLAQWYVSAGEKSLAKQELKTLSSLGDKFSEQAEVKAMLEAL